MGEHDAFRVARRPRGIDDGEKVFRSYGAIEPFDEVGIFLQSRFPSRGDLSVEAGRGLQDFGNRRTIIPVDDQDPLAALPIRGIEGLAELHELSRRFDDQEGRVGMPEDKGRLLGCRVGASGYADGPQGHEGEVRDGPFETIVDKEGDMVALPDPFGLEAGGHDADGAGELRIGPGLGSVLDPPLVRNSFRIQIGCPEGH